MGKKKSGKKKSDKEVPATTGRSVHEQNKREAFDGMRAYHQSEISHKKDAIDILKTYLTTVVIIYAGLVAGITGKIIDNNYIVLLGWAVALLNGIACWAIIRSTNFKIDKDNRKYNQYRDEYIVERAITGLENDLKEHGHVSHWIEAQEEPVISGYNYTKKIINWFGITIVAVGLFGAIVISLAAVKLKKTENKKQAVTTFTRYEWPTGSVPIQYDHSRIAATAE